MKRVIAPEVAEEALEVVRVQQFCLAAVGLLRQTVPALVDLELVIIDALCLVGMRLHETLGGLIQVFHLLSDGGEVAFESLMLALEALNCGKVMSKVSRTEGRLFLFDPVLCLVSISVMNPK